MPMNLGYVLTCYGLFLFTIIFYVINLIHKKNKYTELLKNLKPSSQHNFEDSTKPSITK